MSQEIMTVAPAPDEEQGSLIQIVQLPIIKERLHKLKEYVSQQVADAMAMVCTEDTVIEVKQIRAELSAVFNEAEIQRKAVKNAVMQPYLDFEAVYKDCISDPFKKADADLRGKIYAVESEMKARCEAALREYFDEFAQANGVGFLRYEQAGISVTMTDARAKTQPPKKLREQVEKFILRVGQDVDMILCMDHADEILAFYKQVLNASQAVTAVNEQHLQIERAREEKERRTAAKAQEAEAKRNVEAFAPPTVSEPEKVDELLTVTFSITDTRERLKLLKQILDMNEFKYTN